MSNKFWADEILRLYWELGSMTKARLKVRKMMKEWLTCQQSEKS